MEEWKDFTKNCQFRYATSSPNYTESNGLAERVVQTVKGMWKKDSDKAGALLAYRTTHLKSGCRPEELMFGRTLRMMLPLQHTVPTDTHDFRNRDYHLEERQKRNHDSGTRAGALPGLMTGTQCG